MLGEIIRISASEIDIQWIPASDDVLTYLVKYRPIQASNIQKRDVDDLSIIVETNRTAFVISGLDPRFAYVVSVAAINGGGAGNYSEEAVIGCELYGH